jgi:hypothetical protein
MRENDAFNGITDVMQAIASSDIAINEVWPQRGKLSGGKLREKLVGQTSLVAYQQPYVLSASPSTSPSYWSFCNRHLLTKPARVPELT